MECLQYKEIESLRSQIERVLNLVINGMPSILEVKSFPLLQDCVLNLVINGMPSIPLKIADLLIL